MAASTDMLVATALARAARGFRPTVSGARAGMGFEQHLFQSLVEMYPWHHAAGPDQFDMVNRVRSSTGTRYEYDGAFETEDTLYVVEAKHLGKVSREHVSAFVMKLVDMMLGSSEGLEGLDIKPVFVSALPQIDTAAWTFAVAWGVLLISPTRLTPCEIIAETTTGTTFPTLREQLRTDCQALLPLLWRPLNHILFPSGAKRFTIDGGGIYEAGHAGQILDNWHECCAAAERLGIGDSAAVPQVS